VRLVVCRESIVSQRPRRSPLVPSLCDSAVVPPCLTDWDRKTRHQRRCVTFRENHELDATPMLRVAWRVCYAESMAADSQTSAHDDILMDAVETL